MAHSQPLHWLELSLCVKGEQTAEQIINSLEVFDPLSISQYPLDHSADIEVPPGLKPRWEKVRICALFADSTDLTPVMAKINTIIQDKQKIKLYIERVADQDWHLAWKQRLQPRHISGKLWICPAGTKPPQEDAINLNLEPGLAFGTGSHPTTALCLEALVDIDLRGKTIIDYGCGSGIIAIAALLLDAESAWGVDIDERALAVSRENAARNDTADRLQVTSPEKLPIEITGDYIFANILSSTLIELAPEIDKRTKLGGKLFLSGILQPQVESVMDVYRPNYRFTQQIRDNWVLLTGSKITASPLAN